MIDLTPLLQALIGLAAALITAYVIPYIRGKTSKETLEKMKAWAAVGVKAAEQIYSGPGRGEEKMAYVLNFLQKNGFTVTAEQLTALIEATVNDMNNG